MAASIRDVAREAGVSVGTVSRALNGYSDIREATKERILAVAKELCYVPNISAKSLSTKAPKNMAILLAGFMADRGLSDELVIKLLRGACGYAIKNNIELAVYVISSEQQSEKSFEQFCSEHSLTGAMCFGLKTSDIYYECLQKSMTPCVTVDVLVEGQNIGYVGSDNVLACYELTKQVIAQGHRKIVFLNGREEATVCSERYEGIAKALDEQGLKLEENVYMDFQGENAENYVKNYLATHGTNGATAFVCASDTLALGAARGISLSGYKVGTDISVTGFDGMYFAYHGIPVITTIDQNMEEKGFAAAEMLHAIVDDRPTTRYSLIPHSMVTGETLQPCKITN